MELEPVEIQNAKMYLGWPIFRKQKGFLNLSDIKFIFSELKAFLVKPQKIYHCP